MASLSARRAARSTGPAEMLIGLGRFIILAAKARHRSTPTKETALDSSEVMP